MLVQKEREKYARTPKSVRLEVVELFLTGKKDLWELKKEYKVSDSRRLYKWVQELETEVREQLSEKTLSLRVMQDSSKDNDNKGNPLEEENKRLKEILYQSNLKIEALETLITLAEQNYQVSIRKNFAAKQSKCSGKGTVR